MPTSIEIAIGSRTNAHIETSTKAIDDIVMYLNEKYKGWEEFVLTNAFERQLRIVRIRNNLTQLPKTLLIGNLSSTLDKLYKDWSRIAISNKKFNEIKYSDCVPGMLVRGITSATKQYIYVEKISQEADGKVIIHCDTEGEKVDYNSLNNVKYRFALLCSNLDETEYYKIDWPRKKKAKEK